MNGPLLVFGGGGFVGGNLCTLALRDGWEVHVADAAVRDALPGATWHRIDVTEGEAVAALVSRRAPGAVIVRVSLVLGFPATDGNFFIVGLEKKLAAGTAVPCPVDEIRTRFEDAFAAYCGVKNVIAVTSATRGSPSRPSRPGRWIPAP